MSKSLRIMTFPLAAASVALTRLTFAKSDSNVGRLNQSPLLVLGNNGLLRFDFSGDGG